MIPLVLHSGPLDIMRKNTEQRIVFAGIFILGETFDGREESRENAPSSEHCAALEPDILFKMSRRQRNGKMGIVWATVLICTPRSDGHCGGEAVCGAMWPSVQGNGSIGPILITLTLGPQVQGYRSWGRSMDDRSSFVLVCDTAIAAFGEGQKVAARSYQGRRGLQTRPPQSPVGCIPCFH